jgi:hypothetical protein
VALSNQPQPRRPEDWFPPVRPAAVDSVSAATIAELQTTLAPSGYSFTAGEALGGHRAITVADDGLAYHAQPNDPSARTIAGVTTGAVVEGDLVNVRAGGIITNLSWAWIEEQPVWLAADGLLTQTTPTSGYLVQVGVPVGPTQLRVAPQFVAFLGG